MNHHAKLRRAYEHLEGLAAKFRAFAESKPYSGTFKYDLDSDEWVARVKVIRDVDPLWSLAIGDALHNMRSALDNMAFALVEKHSGPPDKPRRVQFPIFDGPDPAKARDDFHAKRERHIGGMHPDAIAFIESIQPYHRADRKYRPQLTVLNDLSNIDKHRRIHVTGAVGSLLNVRLIMVDIIGFKTLVGQARTVHAAKIPVVDGAIVARFKVPPPPGIPPRQLQMHGDYAIDITFAREWPAWGASVYGALMGIHDYIRDDVFNPLDNLLK